MPPDELTERYELRSQLGRGSMGAVYAAVDRFIGRQVAIKVVEQATSGDAESAEAVERFRREAQAAGRLSHPNIVVVHDYGENAKQAWIVMELVEGGSLKDRFDRGERFILTDALRIMDELLRGLAHAHAAGVAAHRDIKPANIMLTRQGTVKIADFGIARIENSSMTQLGSMMGTPSCMAPEQFRGEPVDHRADIWAAGVVLYQLLTGDKPFDGGFNAVMHKVLTTEPPPPSQLSVTALRALDAVVVRALAKRPEDRFASAAEFADAIKAAAPGPSSLVEQPAESMLVVDEDATVYSGVGRRGTGGSVPPRATPPTAMPPSLPEDVTIRAPDERSQRPIDPVASAGAIKPQSAGMPRRAVFGAGLVLASAVAAYWWAFGSRIDKPTRPQVPIGTQSASQPSAQPSSSVAQAQRSAPPQESPQRSAAPQSAAHSSSAEVSVVQSSGQVAAQAPALAPAQSEPPAQGSRVQPSALHARPRTPDLQAAGEAASAVRCSLVAWSVADQRLTVSGVVSRRDEEEIRRAITARGVSPSAMRLDLQPFDGPYCDILEIIRPALGGFGATPVASVVGTLPLMRGERLQIDVEMPPWPAHLHVAYFDKLMNVAHLVSARATQPGQRYRLGQPGPGFEGFVVDEPFGTDMVVVIASERPLFDPAVARPSIESQAQFMPDLDKALQAELAAKRRVVVRPVVIETVANRP